LDAIDRRDPKQIEFREVEDGVPILGQAGDRLLVLGALFVGDTSIAASAAARVIDEYRTPALRCRI
jgi:hypothetical protein